MFVSFVVEFLVFYGSSLDKDAAEPEVLVYAQIADANTGRVITASSIHCTSWREYLAYVLHQAGRRAGTSQYHEVVETDVRGTVQPGDGEDGAYLG
jgi:hypothetical protein